MKGGNFIKRFEDLSELSISGSVTMTPEGFEIRLSYHITHDIQSLSLNSNLKYVSKSKWEIAGKFSDTFEYFTNYSNMDFNGEFLRNALIKLNCLTEEKL